MDNINAIINNSLYKDSVKILEEIEKERIYCNHTMEHFLDVARIAYIKVLEKNLSYSKEVIYAIGLLHDIGRVLEYTENIPHHEGSVILSKEILQKVNFTEDEKEAILNGIENHRKETSDELSKIIYESDKLSRMCLNCKAEESCKWSKEKKNFNIIY